MFTKNHRLHYVVGLAVILGVVIVATGQARVHRSNASSPPNPYHLTSADTHKLASYFAAASAYHDYQISSRRLYQWVYRDRRPVFILDVRQPIGVDSFLVGHIKGSHNIPLQLLAHEI